MSAPPAEYSYNGEGQVTSAGYPGDAGYFYTYDTMGRPTEMRRGLSGTDWVKDVTYGPAGELTQMKYFYATSSGHDYFYTENRSYNNRLQLTNLSANAENFAYTQVNLTYNYSPSQNNGQITSQQDAISGETVSYTYDTLGQLTAASTSGPQWGLAFTYDGFGNRTTQSLTKGSGPTVSLSINPANNRINSSGYTYDANGNLTAMPGSTFVYDIENRMVQVTSSGSEYYGYDPWNQRVWKTTTTDGAGKIFFYGAMGELKGTYSCGASCWDSATTVETNLHFAGKLIRWDNGAVVLDRLGGVRKRSNVFASPQIGQDSSYYPFGEERTATGQDRTKFATYYRDSKTGFDYAMNRYYNNQWGRFLTPDSYGPSANPANPLSWNRYAYVANDPINHNDPSGLNLALYIDGVFMGEFGGGVGGIAGGDGGGIGGSVSPPWEGGEGGSSGAGDFLLAGLVGPPLEPRRGRTGNPDPCDRSDPGNAQKLDWIAAHRSDAEKVAKELGVTTADILGLSALESTWGTNRFAKEGNNFFSLHYPASLATGFITAKGDPTVKVATFAGYGDSAESFRLDYGSLVKNISDPAKFAASLQNAGKYGINSDGSKVATFVGSTAATIRGLAKRLDCD